MAAPDLVVKLRAADVHHQRPALGDDILQREVDLIGPAGHVANRTHRRMNHQRVARRDAERAEVASEFVSRVHVGVSSGFDSNQFSNRRSNRIRAVNFSSL